MKNLILLSLILIPQLWANNPLSPFSDANPNLLDPSQIHSDAKITKISEVPKWSLKQSEKKLVPVSLHPPKNTFWDLGNKLWFCVDVKNNNFEKSFIRAELNSGKKKVLGGVVVEGNQTKTLAIFLPKADPSLEKYQDLYGQVKSLPNGSVSVPWREIDSSKITKLQLFSYSNSGVHNLEFSNFRSAANYTALNHSNFANLNRPYSDIYGQSTLTQWLGKIKNDQDFQEQKRVEFDDLIKNPGAQNLTKYGGLLNGPSFEATGHFYVKKINSKWWFIDPEGKLFWSFGITSVNNASITQEPQLHKLFPNVIELNKKQGLKKNLWNPRLLNIEKKYGSNWSADYPPILHQRLKSWGINTLGNWSTKEYYSLKKTPYTLAVHYKSKKLSDDKKALPDIFHHSFKDGLRDRLMQFSEEANDPWCIGFFIDNELDFGTKALQSGIKILAARKTSSTYLDAINQLKNKYPTIDHLNQSWGTTFPNWNQVTWKKQKTTQKYKSDLLYLGSRYLDKYFSTCAQFMKEYAPNKLYLGSRIHRKENSLALKLSAKYCDVTSINCYDFSPLIIKLPKDIDTPVIIGEFHFGTLNERGVWGGGLCTSPDMTQAAEQLQLYLEHAIADPRFVGAHYFQLYDQALTGRKDGENYRIGFLSITDTPYPSMVTAAREIAAKMYSLRSAENSLLSQDK